MILRRRAALVLLAAAGAVLLLAHAPMTIPSHPSWDEVERWYLEVGPAAAVMSLLRLASQVAAAWLVLVSGLQVVASHGTQPRLGALADRLAPRFLRSVACGAATLSLGVGLGGPAVPGGPPPGTAVMVPLDAPATTTTTTATTTTTTTTVPRRATPPSPPPVVPAPDEVVVEAGESFWSIAEDEAGDGEVEPLWRALIDLNRERLVDPSNPDLLYPGQVLRLP